MQRIVVVVGLKEGASAAALELLEVGPPFNPGSAGFDAHRVYVTRNEVVFVFEGADAAWRLDDVVSDFFQPEVRNTIERWRALLDGEPRVAREVYTWERGSG
jgi:hypothetical protein